MSPWSTVISASSGHNSSFLHVVYWETKNTSKCTRSGNVYVKFVRHLSCRDINLQPRDVVTCAINKDYPSKEDRWNDGPKLWNAEEIAQVVDGVVVANGLPGTISTDSRKLNEGEWFLPLVGPNYDGHQFLQQALDRGCAGAIARAVSPGWPRGYVRVEDDTLRVLHRLAASVRARYAGAVVGITGTTGKTTTRAMTALALQSAGIIHQTEGNFNNHIGLPLTLLKLPLTASACVLEMGMSKKGEILVLADIAQPSVRVLLNVGPAHMENFGSLEEVAAAKGELLSQSKPGDVCILNADDPLVMSLPIPRGVRVVLFGSQDGCHVKIAHSQATRGGRAVWVVLDHCYPTGIWMETSSSGSQILENLKANSDKPSDQASSTNKTTDRQTYLQTRTANINRASNRPPMGDCLSSSGVRHISRVEFEVSSPGLHLALNACAAAAVAVSLGLPLQTVGKSLAKYCPIGMRSRWEEASCGIQLINDAYNSNPMSIKSGLKLLDSIECPGRRIALLGDMLELGSASKTAHLEALALCQQLNIDIVGLVGPSFSRAACSLELDKGNRIVMIFKDSEELAKEIEQFLRPGDAVLVKGSRGIRMEVVANAIKTKPLKDLSCF